MRLPDMEEELAERLDPKFRRQQAAEERRLAARHTGTGRIDRMLREQHLKDAARLERMAARLGAIR